MPEVKFHSLFSWALEPTGAHVNRTAAKDKAALYREEFRFQRAERVRELCPPWAMGEELGWRVRSPIDVALTELPQTEVDGSVEPERAGGAAGKTELWQRGASHLAVGKSTWLHLHQFRGRLGWENMFLPNGEGSVEWRLGWTVDLPRGYFLMVMPSAAAPPALDVPVGILSTRVTERAGRENGMSIAVRPTGPVEIARGQEVARLVLLHADSLQVNRTRSHQQDASS